MSSASRLARASTASTSSPSPSPSSLSRRDALRLSAASAASLLAAPHALASAPAAAVVDPARRAYTQTTPTLFAPFYGDDSRATVLKTIVPGQVYALEQNLEVGPLETPLRCVVVKLRDGALWVHAPLAPTMEFFELVETGIPDHRGVEHVVVPTYAFEHKIFAKDALRRWPDARLWVAPGQFSFPVEVPSRVAFGREPDGVLGGAADGGGVGDVPPWIDEISVRILKAGKFALAGKDVTIREATFYHAASRTMIVTDALARVPYEIPELQVCARGFERFRLRLRVHVRLSPARPSLPRFQRTSHRIASGPFRASTTDR